MVASRGKIDSQCRRIEDVLKKKYLAAHPEALIKVYRYNSVSIRVRIIDPDFAGVNRTSRDAPIWAIINELPEDTRTQISMLLLLAPDEVPTSLINQEFDNPRPSRL